MFKLKERFLLFLATMASSHAEDRRLRMAEKCVYKYYTPYWVRCVAAHAERRNPVRESALCANSAAASTRLRTMSQAAHNKIAAAQRARWAKTRAQQKKAA